MLSKELINGLIETVKEKGRKLDYYLLSNLFDCRALKVLEELKKYQNPDGGFGHGLEPDVTLPNSNIVSTNEAVLILLELDEEEFVECFIKEIVGYYEATYIVEKNRWDIVPKEVDLYPRAIWWNYKDVDSFGYGNPTPQIIGFLYKYQRYLKKLDIDIQVNRVVDYIVRDFPNESRKHNIISCLYFYKYMPENIRSKIRQVLQTAIDRELENTNWEEYCLQPFEVKLIAPEFLENHRDILIENIIYREALLTTGPIMPNWKWGQYEAAFEKAKYEWSGILTYQTLRAILL